jgi:hypothetical protein
MRKETKERKKRKWDLGTNNSIPVETKERKTIHQETGMMNGE